MGKILGIAALLLLGLVAFAVFGAVLPDANPLHGVAEGIRSMGRGIINSVAGVGRGVGRSFGG